MHQLGIFAKYWAPGRVKTRLARVIGAESASRLARAFLATQLQRFRSLADRRDLVYEPPERGQAFRRLAGPAWTLVPQPSGNLGQRMLAYLQRAFDETAQRVVLIGADSPTLPPGMISRAFELLGDFPVVLGPSNDGGYYLVGAANSAPPIFDDIDWSTTSVWDQTVTRLSASGIPYACLPAWYDIDDFDDLQRLARDLAECAPRPSDFQDLRAAVASILGSAAVTGEGPSEGP